MISVASSRSQPPSSVASSHQFTLKGRAVQNQELRAWVTVPVNQVDGKVQFKPRDLNSCDDACSSMGSTAWDVKSHYMMAMRSGPTECPDHLLAKEPEFAEELRTFPSPYALYYFDETAPNNILLSNDLKLKKKVKKPDHQRIPTKHDSKSASKNMSKKEALSYEERLLYFDADDIRIPEGGTGLKLLPSYTVSYKSYPAISYTVLAPKNYREFFRIRERPGMFA